MSHTRRGRFFSRYQIFVSPECAGECRTFGIRRIVPRLCLLSLLALMVSASLLAYRVISVNGLHAELAAVEEIRLRQRDQLLTKARELVELRSEYSQVAELNGKLKVMLNMAAADDSGEGLGGDGISFTNAMLVPYDMRVLVRNMQMGTQSLSRDIHEAERVQQDVLNEVRRNMTTLAWTPSVWPVRGRVTSSFGMRNHPFDSHSRMHQGVDIVPASGRNTPIKAPANGVVTFVGRQGYYGKTLVLSHQGGITTRYAHLQDYAVKEGQTVSRGETIAFVGNTGRSTGPHLHYEVLVDGRTRNPRQYILD